MIAQSPAMREWNSRHEAMALLHQAWWKPEANRAKITRILDYLRRTTYDCLPWDADVLPNKDSYGRRS